MEQFECAQKLLECVVYETAYVDCGLSSTVQYLADARKISRKTGVCP